MLSSERECTTTHTHTHTPKVLSMNADAAGNDTQDNASSGTSTGMMHTDVHKAIFIQWHRCPATDTHTQ